MKKNAKSKTSVAPAAAKPPAREWDYSATSATPATTPLRRRGDTPRTPRVIYTTRVYQQITYLVHRCNLEVGWWGLVDVQPCGDYLITEIFVPEQEVTGTQTDIEAEAMTALAIELMDRDLDPGNLYYYGHSHVNMGVSPSGQDESNTDQYLDACPIFIREIRNKKGESKVDIFDTAANVVYQCVENIPEWDLIPGDVVQEINDIVESCVKERKYQQPATTAQPKSLAAPKADKHRDTWLTWDDYTFLDEADVAQYMNHQDYR